MSSVPGQANPFSYCRDFVRNHDYASYLNSYFYPKDAQNGYFALKAFSVELALIQDAVSSAMIGKMRMQFWRDAVKGIFDGKPPKHPIALALHQTSQKHRLQAYHLKRIIEARDDELHTPVHLTVDTLTSHAESTSSTVLYLLLSLLSSAPSSTATHAASHLGVAQTFTTLLRALPFHASKGRMVIPAEITAKHGVSQDEVFRTRNRARGIEDAVYEFATMANDHMITSRDMFRTVPRDAMPIFIGGVPVTLYLERLEEVKFDVFHPSLQVRDWKLPWRVWRGFHKDSDTALDRTTTNPKTDLQLTPVNVRATSVLAAHRLASWPSSGLVSCPSWTVYEVLQLIFFELNDPTHLILVSKRFHRFSQVPYVRAHYFLARYGPIQAMFWALGRGKIITERVIDILLSSGAHFSRYLIQVAAHHYFRTSAHFIKSNWVRSVSFPVFTYFLKLAADTYGEIPCGKGEDDGTTFSNFLKESRFPAAMKTTSWEEIRNILEKFNFIPFCNKDPIMAQFPLALAIEPRLLPLATANGFRMDSKYRDFIFRKMFERPTVTSDSRTDEIIHNVRELCRLDSSMFLSRTVAAEVCMEARVNEQAYAALKKLGEAGELRFDLSTLVEDLIKLFLKTRSVTMLYTIQILRQLFTDFPSTDQTVRLVILLTVFLSDNCLAHTTPATLRSKLEPLGLIPLTRKDIFNVLTNPFVERYAPILEFAKVEVGLNAKVIRELVEEVAVACLEVGCKGKMLRRLFEGFPFLHDTISMVVVQRYSLALDDLPHHEDEKACAAYEAKLCRDFSMCRGASHTPLNNGGEGRETIPVSGDHEAGDGEREGDDVEASGDDAENDAVNAQVEETPQLGRIGQDTLTNMIHQDEMPPSRARRRNYYPYSFYGDLAGKMQYPHDAVQVGRWVKNEFGVRSDVTAIFMTHAVINNNSSVIQHYLGHADINHQWSASHVPITLKHFKIMARLGRAPTGCLYHEIEMGAEFYFSETDYFFSRRNSEPRKYQPCKFKFKAEATQGNDSLTSLSSFGPSSKLEGPSRVKNRPRRMAAETVGSYAVPGSDDEAILDDDPGFGRIIGQSKRKRAESSLQRWIKHLSVLLKEEQQKFKEKKKRIEKSAAPDTKVRVPKTEFYKSLTSNLRNLRKVELEKRIFLHGSELVDEDHTDDDDDEYFYRSARGKRRKTMTTTTTISS